MTSDRCSFAAGAQLAAWSGRVAIAGAAAAVVLAAVRTITAPDFWGALAVGRAIVTQGIVRTDLFTFTSPGAPWLDVQWLYHLTLYALWSAGKAPLVLMAKLVAMAGSLALVAGPAARRGGAIAAGLAVALLLVIIAPHTDLSAPLMATLPAAWLIWAVRGRRRLVILYGAAVPAQVLWINLDATGVLGPAIAAIGSAASLWELRQGHWRPGSRQEAAIRLALPLVLAVALLAQPYGIGGLRWIFRHADSFFRATEGSVVPSLAALQPPSVTAWVFYAWLLICGAGIVVSRDTGSAVDIALVVAGLALLLYLPATLPFFPLLAAPFTAHAAGQLIGAFRGAPTANLAAALGAIAFAATVPIRARHADAMAAFAIRAEDRHLPAAFAAAMARHHLSPRMFCMPADGAMLSWALPGCSVFADRRAGISADNRPVDVQTLLNGGEGAERQLRDQWNVDAVLLNCLVPPASTLAARWQASGRWDLAYFDGVSALLVARNSDAAARAPMAALREEGLRVLRADGAAAAAPRRRGRANVSPRIAGAALFYIASAHPREAASALELLRAAGLRHPVLDSHMGRAWMAAGQPEAAVEAWQRYTRARPNDLDAQRRLVDALHAAGRHGDADRACKKAGLPPHAAP